MAPTRQVISVPAGRRRRLARRLGRQGADAMLVSAPPNVRYLSGFRGEDSYLLLGPRWAVLLTDSRFTEQARQEAADLDHHIRTGAMLEAIVGVAAEHGVKRLAVEAEAITLELYRKLETALGKRALLVAEGWVAEARATKDAEELAAIRRAIRVAERAFRALTAGGAGALVGRSEADVAGELEYRMRQGGASGASFPSIGAVGAPAALPHHRPGDTKIGPGQAVLFDWGAVVEGYCSDLTRVVFTGTIPPQIGRIYAVVLEAQKQGVSAVRAGRSPRSVDRAARAVIESAGFGPQFGHGLGHGIGLEIHEAPTLSHRARGRLKRGAVVTVEPGIYLPGVGGVRIEDDVLVETGGGRVLSSLPKSLQAMVLK